MAKEIKYGAEARAALEAGVDKLANTVRSDRRDVTWYLTSPMALRSSPMMV